ncbi:MAG TPA: polysaccharide ABC transporter ATP-binding protein [Candidatus Acidoferrales bacterium]|nr:polysaccharide ABC transporter ATP-binding protein [Candidatus Acidoferrales bacterium]
MTQIAIRVENLSKRYEIGARETYGSLRDALRHVVGAPVRRFRTVWNKNEYSSSGKSPTIWALRDVSFDVKQGEVLGLIGRNGAGKSTVLKILSRITNPTEGRAGIRGRIRSLLEVGTGFHPELTGRENIYLNGAILGMKRAEIEARFDEIVAFAEVEKFLDTPVKRYSSGMYLRLAFAVAAHLVSEILLVDEVLAVGDAAFQKKCIGRMNEVAHEGRTVVFVSHNMAAVRTLCNRGICLEQGRIASAGPIEQVLYSYTQSQVRERPNSGHMQTRFASIRVNGQNPGSIESGESFQVDCTLELVERVPSFRLFCIIQDVNGEAMVVVPSNSRDLNVANQAGVHQICVRFPGLWLRPGVYSVYFKLLAVAAGSGDARFLSDSIMLDVTGNDDPEMLLGCLAPSVRWEVTGSLPSSEAIRDPLVLSD